MSKSVSFRYLSTTAGIDIEVNNLIYTLTEEAQKEVNSEEGKTNDITKSSENYIKKLETQGAENILVKNDQFITPNAAEGIKTYGSFQIEVNGIKYNSNYTILIFRADNVKQQIVLTWRNDDIYAEDIIKRILDSIELRSDEAVEQEQEQE